MVFKEWYSVANKDGYMNKLAYDLGSIPCGAVSSSSDLGLIHMKLYPEKLTRVFVTISQMDFRNDGVIGEAFINLSGLDKTSGSGVEPEKVIVLHYSNREGATVNGEPLITILDSPTSVSSLVGSSDALRLALMNFCKAIVHYNECGRGFSKVLDKVGNKVVDDVVSELRELGYYRQYKVMYVFGRKGSQWSISNHNSNFKYVNDMSMSSVLSRLSSVTMPYPSVMGKVKGGLDTYSNVIEVLEYNVDSVITPFEKVTVSSELFGFYPELLRAYEKKTGLTQGYMSVGMSFSKSGFVATMGMSEREPSVGVVVSYHREDTLGCLGDTAVDESDLVDTDSLCSKIVEIVHAMSDDGMSNKLTTNGYGGIVKLYSFDGPTVGEDLGIRWFRK